jgi:hypothetical protein
VCIYRSTNKPKLLPLQGFPLCSESRTYLQQLPNGPCCCSSASITKSHLPAASAAGSPASPAQVLKTILNDLPAGALLVTHTLPLACPWRVCLAPQRGQARFDLSAVLLQWLSAAEQCGQLATLFESFTTLDIITEVPFSCLGCSVGVAIGKPPVLLVLLPAFIQARGTAACTDVVMPVRLLYYIFRCRRRTQRC